MGEFHEILRHNRLVITYVKVTDTGHNAREILSNERYKEEGSTKSGELPTKYKCTNRININININMASMTARHRHSVHLSLHLARYVRYPEWKTPTSRITTQHTKENISNAYRCTVRYTTVQLERSSMSSAGDRPCHTHLPIESLTYNFLLKHTKKPSRPACHNHFQEKSV